MRPAGLNLLLLVMASLLMNGCESGPEPIVAGKDNCYLCKMGITDTRYAAEVLTKKGKLYKFDDIDCLLSFVHSAMIDKQQVKEIYLVDFAGDHELVKASACFLLRDGKIHSPMNGNVIAFKNKDSLEFYMPRLKGERTNWEQLYK